MDLYHCGTKLSVWLCDGAKESWDAAEVSLMSGHKAQLRARLSLLADQGSLRVPDHMNSEGEGIHAVKANCGLRAYGWFAQVDGRRGFVISHVILKKKQKLDPADRERALAAKTIFETENST